MHYTTEGLWLGRSHSLYRGPKKSVLFCFWSILDLWIHKMIWSLTKPLRRKWLYLFRKAMNLWTFPGVDPILSLYWSTVWKNEGEKNNEVTFNPQQDLDIYGIPTDLHVSMEKQFQLWRANSTASHPCWAPSLPQTLPFLCFPSPNLQEFPNPELAVLQRRLVLY